MDNFQRYRLRTVQAILQKLDSLDGNLQTWDYKLDDLAREIFNLPDRPEGSKPYLGWLGESKQASNPARSEVNLAIMTH